MEGEVITYSLVYLWLNRCGRSNREGAYHLRAESPCTKLCGGAIGSGAKWYWVCVRGEGWVIGGAAAADAVGAKMWGKV